MVLSTIQASKNNFWFYYPFWDQAMAKKKPNHGLWLIMNGLANFGYWSAQFGQLVVISYAMATLFQPLSWVPFKVILQQLDNLVVPVHFSNVQGDEPRCIVNVSIGALLEQQPDNLFVPCFWRIAAQSCLSWWQWALTVVFLYGGLAGEGHCKHGIYKSHSVFSVYLIN